MKAQSGLLVAILIGIFIIFTGLLISENISIVGILNTTQNITQNFTTVNNVTNNITNNITITNVTSEIKWLNTTSYLYINSSYPTFFNTSMNCTQIFGSPDTDFCTDATGTDTNCSIAGSCSPTVGYINYSNVGFFNITEDIFIGDNLTWGNSWIYHNGTHLIIQG